MPMNRIQFQPGLLLAEFLRHEGDEAQCEAAVVKARWPNGFVCDRCQCTRSSPTHNGLKRWQCKGCGDQSPSSVGQRHGAHQAGFDDVVSSHVLDDAKQERHRSAVPDAPSRGGLSQRMADSPQTHAGHVRA